MCCFYSVGELSPEENPVEQERWLEESLHSLSQFKRCHQGRITPSNKIEMDRQGEGHKYEKFIFDGLYENDISRCVQLKTCSKVWFTLLVRIGNYLLLMYVNECLRNRSIGHILDCFHLYIKFAQSYRLKEAVPDS